MSDVISGLAVLAALAVAVGAIALLFTRSEKVRKASLANAVDLWGEADKLLRSQDGDWTGVGKAVVALAAIPTREVEVVIASLTSRAS